jgi:hypothetical protein
MKVDFAVGIGKWRPILLETGLLGISERDILRETERSGM